MSSTAGEEETAAKTKTSRAQQTKERRFVTAVLFGRRLQTAAP
jgi:hypothetical protein